MEYPSHPTPGPIYYKPYSAQSRNAHLRNKRDTGSATSRQSYSKFEIFHHSTTQYPQYHEPVTHAPQYQQYPQPAPHAPLHQQHAEYSYAPKTRFDDAPEIVYGTAIRTREIFDCNEPGQDCESLEHYGKVVDCNIARFR